MRIHVPVTIDIPYAKSLGIVKLGHLIPLRYDDIYEKKMQEEIKKVIEKNAVSMEKYGKLIQIDCDLNIHYAQRSLDQNRWLWKAHEIEAKIVNTKDQIWRDEKGITWYKPGAITPEEIHESYNERCAPRAKLIVDANNVPFFRKMLLESTGKIVSETIIDAGHVQIEIWKTSSYMNVAEFCQLSEHVKGNLLSYGVDLENASDYSALIADLDTWKREAEKKEAEANVPQCADSVDDIPILTFRKDPVKIVENVFNGKRED
jgi:hypothetical protein